MMKERRLRLGMSSMDERAGAAGAEKKGSDKHHPR